MPNTLWFFILYLHTEPISLTMTILIKQLRIIFLLCCICSIKATAQEIIQWKDALQQEENWYGSKEAIRIADNLLLYQSKLGGWPKNIDMAKPITKSQIDEAKASNENHINETTIDNKATYQQVEYLANVFNATQNKIYKNACIKGINFMLDAQYENGGWPQFYPLRKGYYSHITFNDGAMIGVMRFLQNVVDNKFSFIDSNLQERCAESIKRGVTAILKCQVKINGTPTVWCAQHDENNFEPTKARAYELPTLSGSESVGIVKYLLSIKNPNAEIIDAINYAITWFEASKIEGIRLIKIDNPAGKNGFDYVVGFDPNNKSPMWARFYELETNYPIFVGRDGVVHYSIGEIEIERRTGYAWLSNWAEDLLTKHYPAWCKKHGLINQIAKY